MVDKQTIHDIKLPQSNDKLQFPVCLMINDDKLKAKLETRPSIDMMIIVPLGENLAYHIETLIRNIFVNVIVNYNSDISLSKGEIKYFIIPKLLLAEYIRPYPAWSTAKTTMTIEWKLVNKSGKNVWIETIIGAYTGKWKEGNTRYFLKETFNDLLQKSQEKILSSKVLRNLQ
jgi:hypothetical protein